MRFTEKLCLKIQDREKDMDVDFWHTHPQKYKHTQTRCHPAHTYTECLSPLSADSVYRITDSKMGGVAEEASVTHIK